MTLESTELALVLGLAIVCLALGYYYALSEKERDRLSEKGKCKQCGVRKA